MSRRTILAGAAASATLLAIAMASTPVRADGWAITGMDSLRKREIRAGPGKFYLDTELEWDAEDEPDWNYGSLLNSSGPAIEQTPFVIGGKLRVTLGYRLDPKYGLGRLLGDKAARRWEVAQTTGPTPGPVSLPTVLTFSISGRGTTDTSDATSNGNARNCGIGFAAGCRVSGGPRTGRLNQTSSGVEAALGYASALPLRPGLAGTPPAFLVGKPVTLTLGGNLFFGYRRDVYDFRVDDIVLTSGIGPPTPLGPGVNTVNQSVNTYYYGVAFTAAADIALSPRWSVGLGGMVGVVMSHYNLKGTDCIDGTANVAGCQAAIASKVSNSSNHVGVRLGGRVNVSYDAGFAVLGLVGAVKWSNAAPAVVNPTGANQAAYVTNGNSLGFAALFKVTVPLN